MQISLKGEITMQKSKKLTAVYALIMDLPLSIIVTLVALLLGGNLSMSSFIPSCILAYVVTFILNFLPVGKWGFDFAIKRDQPGTLKFGLLINMVIAFVFTLVLDLIMTYFGVVITAHAPMSEYWKAVAGGFIPCYIASFVVAFLWNNVADKLSRQICNEPAPELGPPADAK
jgi:uncharacterized membrane protein YeaQ/YmgE (transglycosylase-associated protein family)